MIFCTSIAPYHIVENAQQNAVKSWSDYKVYSFNSPQEIKQLKPIYPDVNFIECVTMEGFYGKQYASLQYILEWFKKSEHQCITLINSDNILVNHGKFKEVINKCYEGLVFFNRYDMPRNERYEYGFDAFSFSREHAELIPNNLYSLGNCHFDYQIPYSFINANIPIYRTNTKVFEHVAHKQQYSNDKWLKTGRHFHWINNMEKFKPDAHGIGLMSEFIRQRIIHKTQWI